MLTDNQEKMLSDALLKLLIALKVVDKAAHVDLPMLVCIAEEYTEFLETKE